MTIEEMNQDLEHRMKNPEFRREFGASKARRAVGYLIADARREAGMTQENLAALLGTKREFIAKLETGSGNPSAAYLGGLLALMGCRLEFRASPLLEKQQKQTIPRRGALVRRRKGGKVEEHVEAG